MATFPLYHDADSGSASSFTHGRSASTALGRPNLTSWELFVREALQNSWDARDVSSADDGVTFALDYRRLDIDESEILRRRIFGTGTEHVPSLNAALSKETIPLLIVSDSGTSGLRGPTNAAMATDGPSDFNSFVREIGRSASKEVKGGSYGFGKGVFFTASLTRTILIYTRTIDEDGNRVHRFIAVANSDSFEHQGFKYTGRHWWGVEEEFYDPRTDNTTRFAEPLTGDQADNIASFFKMDRHFTEDKATGTSIAVIDPDFDNPKEQMEQISRALTRWAWPHMVYTPPEEDELHFVVTYNSEEIPVPDPKEDPLLREYVSAYLDSLNADPSAPEGLTFRRSTEISSVRSERPKHGLGRLGIRELPKHTSTEKSIIEDRLNAIALMRGPRMVVEYQSGPVDRLGREYVAVFSAADDLDREFALSEPTTHDAWHPRTLTDHDLDGSSWKSRNNPVRIALTRMESLVAKWGTDASNAPDAPYDSASRQIASMLGEVVTGVAGTGPNGGRTVGGNAPRPKVKSGTKSATFNTTLVNLLPKGDELYAVFFLSGRFEKVSFPATIDISVHVELDTGTTQDWDSLGYTPVIEDWYPVESAEEAKGGRPSGDDTSANDHCTVTLSSDNPNAVVFVRQARALAVRLKASHSKSQDRHD